MRDDHSTLVSTSTDRNNLSFGLQQMFVPLFMQFCLSLPVNAKPYETGLNHERWYAEAAKRSTMDVVVAGSRGLPLSVYYCIPLKHIAVHVNLPNALSASEGYHVVITTNRTI
jgi:hypothetical protein